jgi:hypothetical protein
MAGCSSLQLKRIGECFFVCPYKVGQVLCKCQYQICAQPNARSSYPYEDLPIFGVHRIFRADNSCI